MWKHNRGSERGTCPIQAYEGPREKRGHTIQTRRYGLSNCLPKYHCLQNDDHSCPSQIRNQRHTPRHRPFKNACTFYEQPDIKSIRQDNRTRSKECRQTRRFQPNNIALKRASMYAQTPRQKVQGRVSLPLPYQANFLPSKEAKEANYRRLRLKCCQLLWEDSTTLP